MQNRNRVSIALRIVLADLSCHPKEILANQRNSCDLVRDDTQQQFPYINNHKKYYWVLHGNFRVLRIFLIQIFIHEDGWILKGYNNIPLRPLK